MPGPAYEETVFINCPFDEAYAPLLEAATFTCVYLGFHPQLASNNLEAGENRFEKIVRMVKAAKYSIHDLSRNTAAKKGDVFRMNMPFEFGLDFGLRKSGSKKFRQKKFLIFELKRFDLKKSLSDVAGQDVAYHDGSYEKIIKAIRDFFHAEAGTNAAGATYIKSNYETFQGWLTEKKISEGHSEDEALNLPSHERIGEMWVWMQLGRPSAFSQI